MSHHERWINNILGRAGDVRRSFETFIMRLRADNVTERTIYNYLRVLDWFLKYSKQRGLDYKDWNAELAYKFIAQVNSRQSRVQYAFAIKRFAGVMEYGWAEKFKVPKRPKRKLPDCLTEEQVLKMAKVCDKVRDRALILVTYESSRRNHEIRGLRIRDVKFDQHGALVTFHSTKSEDGIIRLIMSASALQSVIEHHKDRDNPDAFIFYARYSPISELRFRQIVHAAAKKAGINTRVYPHLFRHTRIKIFKDSKMPDDHIMNVSGHTDRRQLDIYGKISNVETNERLLAMQGIIERREEEEAEAKAKVCPRCKFVNGPLATYCNRCSLPLDEKEAFELERKYKLALQALELLNDPKVRDFLKRKAQE